MATFTVEFAEGEIKKPTYVDGYENKGGVNCGSAPIPRTIYFNDSSYINDFVVGYNWDNSLNGDLPPDRIEFEAYQDHTIESDLTTGNQVVLPGPPNPSTLRDSSTGLDLTYPYEISIANLQNIEVHHNDVELTCIQSDLGKYRYTRVRSISYRINDTDGNWGDYVSTTLVTENQT